jgi:hypothetical protein
MRYLNQRGLHDPALIQELHIGYAPGRSLRRHLTTRGYSFDLLRRSACSTRRARMPSTRASSSHCAKANPSSTSTAVVLAPPLPIAFSQAPRADCMPGRKVQQCSVGILVEVEGAVRLCRVVAGRVGGDLGSCQGRPRMGWTPRLRQSVKRHFPE